MPRKGGVPENLKMWPKGVSGNPAGKPKKLPDLDKLMAEVLGAPDGEERKSKAMEIMEALLKQAKKGNTRAAEILLDRGYGKPKEKLEVTGTIKSFTIVGSSGRKSGDSGK